MNRLLLAALALAACGAPPAPKRAATVVEVPRPFASAMAARRAEEAAKAPAQSHRVATIQRKAIGPFAARTEKGALVGWIVAADIGGQQQLVVTPLGADGAPLEAPKAVADVPDEVTSLVVRPAGGARGGWVAAWSALLDRGESLTVIGLAPDGRARAKAADVQRTSDHIRWLDVVPTKSGAVCVWSEETPRGAANVLVAPLDADGKPREMPVRVAQGVEGWAVAPSDDGAGLALVTRPSGNAGDTKAEAGQLWWLRIDAEGRPMAGARPIGSSPTVSGDVDAVASRGQWVLAWTDRTGEDAQVMLATVDPAGRVQGPRRAMDAVGGSVLVALASGASGVGLAWEEPRGRARPMRAMHLAAVSEDGLSASPMSAMELEAGGSVELTATDTGFAFLGTAPRCSSRESCDGEEMPTFVRFDARMAPAQAEPLFVGDVADVRVAATLGWSLRCAGDHCSALAATSETPTPVYSVDLPPRVAPFVAPMTRPPPADAPRVTGLATVASGLPFADVSATHLGDVTLVATLTSAVDANEKAGRRPPGATVAVRAFDAEGQPLGPPAPLTSHAVSVGGVALAAGAQPDDGAALAWVAREDGDPHVHLAKLDRHGRRVGEVSLTGTRGEASSVALAWAGDGWLVAWVDGRDGNGEVYAAKVDRALARVGRDERVTRAPGDASDVSLAVSGDLAWVVWSDPRESPREGLADIYVTTLRTSSATRVGDEVRVLATAAHSRSPEIAATGDGAVVVWIEDSPGEIEGPGAAMTARLGASGHVEGTPQRLPLAAEGRPRSIALASAAGTLHVVVARAVHGEMTLDAVVVPSGAPTPTPAGPWPLLDIDAPSAFDVALALSGDTLFYDDTGRAPGSHRIRRAAIAWHR
jgi:hypothetical protein